MPCSVANCKPADVQALLMPGIKNQAITQTIQNNRTMNFFRCDPGGVLLMPGIKK
jgi:hypothetical protein